MSTYFLSKKTFKYRLPWAHNFKVGVCFVYVILSDRSLTPV